MYSIPIRRLKSAWCFDDGNIISNLGQLQWKQVYGKNSLRRSSCWYTKTNCSCHYHYSGQTYHALNFPPWMQVIAQNLTEELNLSDRPLNSCNCNYYETGSQSLGFHADDEELFQTPDGVVTIVSLSFGADRDFLVKKAYELDSQAKIYPLKQGQLIMDGQMQNHYAHAIGKAPPVLDGINWRYNLTFRNIATPFKRCKACN